VLGGFLAVLFLSHAGCSEQMKTATALRDSVRPAPGSVVLGQTTYAEIVRHYGRPSNEESALKNGSPLTMLIYGLVQLRGEAVAGVLPQRAIIFSLMDGVVVGYAWSSSHLRDVSDFDQNKRFRLQKGQTKRAEALALLGEPTGEYRHPLVKPRDGVGLVYFYTQTRVIPPAQLISETKNLVVTIDGDGVVSDVEYETRMVPVPRSSP